MTKNYDFPVTITPDNRRYFPLKLTDARRSDKQFFSALHEEIVGNIEHLRGYFINREYNTRLPIPHSVVLENMMIESKSFTESFIEEQLNAIYETGNNAIQNVYCLYRSQHLEQGITNKRVSQKTLMGMVNASVETSHGTFRFKQIGT